MSQALHKRLDKIQQFTDKIQFLSAKKQKELGDSFLQAGLALEVSGNYKSIFIQARNNSTGFLRKFYAELANCTPKEIEVLSKHVLNEKIGDIGSMVLDEIVELLKQSAYIYIKTIYDVGVHFSIYNDDYFIRCDKRNTLIHHKTNHQICEFNKLHLNPCDENTFELIFMFKDTLVCTISLEDEHETLA